MLGTLDEFAERLRMIGLHEKHEWWLRDLLERGDRLTS